MKAIWLSIFAVALLAACTTKDDIAKQLPITISLPKSSLLAQEAELAVLIPSDSTVRLVARGDIDGDGDDDALIVMQNSGGEEQEFKPRTLIVLRRNPAGNLEKAIENANAILCRRCGAFMKDDSLEGIYIDGNGFLLRFEGLSRVMWSKEYRFKYSKPLSTWYLYEIKGGVTDRTDGRSCVTQLGPKEFDSVLLAQFDPEQLPICSLP